MRRRATGFVVVAAMGLIVAGCGGSHHDTTTGHATSTTTTASTATTAPAQPGLKAGLRVGDAYQEFTADAFPPHLRIAVLDLRRVGPFLVLDLAEQCVSASRVFRS